MSIDDNEKMAAPAGVILIKVDQDFGININQARPFPDLILHMIKKYLLQS